MNTRYITTSGKISMVRITNGKVSVRIGGGWEPLEEFLSRHNPDHYQFHDTKPIKRKRANSLTKKAHPGTAKIATQKMRKISRQTSQMSSVSRIPRYVPMARLSGTPYSATTRNKAAKKRYERVQYHTVLIFKIAIFVKVLRSRVMA